MFRSPVEADVENPLQQLLVRQARVFRRLGEVLPEGDLRVGVRFQYVESPILGEPDIDPGTLLLDRERAEDRLGDFLERKQELDRNGVLEWGGQDYATVLAVSKSADQAFLKEEYVAAVSAYEEAIARSDTLIARIPEALADLMEEGEAALAQTKGGLAGRPGW